MYQHKKSTLVQYWADNHLVVSGNLYQLINNYTQEKLFQFKADSLSNAFDKCYQFTRYGRIA